MNLDRENLFKGRGLFVFSDPAGRNAVLALVRQLNNQKIIND